MQDLTPDAQAKAPIAIDDAANAKGSAADASNPKGCSTPCDANGGGAAGRSAFFSQAERFASNGSASNSPRDPQYSCHGHALVATGRPIGSQLQPQSRDFQRWNSGCPSVPEPRIVQTSMRIGATSICPLSSNGEYTGYPYAGTVALSGRISVTWAIASERWRGRRSCRSENQNPASAKDQWSARPG